MLKINELRIGNYFLSTKEADKPYVITKASGSIIDYCECKYIYFKPIPLTEEWLLKLPNKLIYPEWIKYLHELQNWYYWNNEKKELHINL